MNYKNYILIILDLNYVYLGHNQIEFVSKKCFKSKEENNYESNNNIFYNKRKNIV